MLKKKYFLGFTAFFLEILFALNSSSILDTDIIEDIRKIQDVHAHHYTLGELLRAADNNYSLQSLALKSLQAKKAVLISKLSFLPSLNLSYNYSNNDSRLNSGANLNYDTQFAQATFTLNLFNGFATWYSIQEKNATYLSSMAEEEFARQNIYLQVTQQFYEYFDNISLLVANQRKLQQIQSDIDRVQRLYNQGLTTLDNLESLKAQEAQAQYSINDVNLNLEKNKLMLGYLTNLNVEALSYTLLNSPSFELKERADISSLEYQIQAISYQGKEAHYYPTIDLVNTFTYNIQKRPLSSSASLGSFVAIFNPDMQNVFGITISWKILDTIGVAVQKQYLKISQLSSEKSLHYKRMEQKKDEQLFRKTLEIAQRKIEYAQTSLQSANTAFDLVKKKYDANLLNFTDYLQALSTKFDAESNLSQTLNNYELQKANYIFYSGQKIRDYIKEEK